MGMGMKIQREQHPINSTPYLYVEVAPVKIKLKISGVRPSFCTRPYDTPYHLRDLYEKELNNCIEAGQNVPCGTEPSQWASEAFPVPKSDRSALKI